MHIFYAADSTPNPFFASQLWRNNLYLPLIDLGHEVTDFDFNWGDTFRKLDTANPEHAAFIEENRPRISHQLISQIRAAHAQKPIEVFFSYFYDACVLPETLDEIQGMGIVTVNWFCNGSYQLHLVQEIAPHYSWCLVPEKFRLKDYEALGARPIYCQEAANPTIYHPLPVTQDLEVAFVGQAYGERPAVLASLIEAGIDVRVWGWGWGHFAASEVEARTAMELRKAWESPTMRMRLGKLKRQILGLPWPELPTSPILPDGNVGAVLSDSEMIRTWNRTKINLGFSSCDTRAGEERILQVRLRDFEVPMSGGFYLVEYMEELEEFFDIGREIVCYRDFKDLEDKIRYYLSHDAEREAIRQAGHERCLRDHTWQKRFAMAFAHMGLHS